MVDKKKRVGILPEGRIIAREIQKFFLKMEKRSV